MRAIKRKCEDIETKEDEERYKLQSAIDSNAKVSSMYNNTCIRASLIRTTLSFVLAGTVRLYAKSTYN